MKIDQVNFNYVSHADDSIADILFYQKKYAEDADIRTFINMVGEAKVVFDVGANTGLYSVVGATVNPNASFYSFEPHPGNCTRLERNVKINNLANVTIVQKAVGDRDGSVQFYVPKSGEIIDTSSVLRDFSESTYQGKISWDCISVLQTTLDRVVEEKAIARVDLMKIDVEGYEIAVFEGGKGVFEKFKPAIICEIFLNDEKKEYFQVFIQRFGYVPYMILTDGLVRMDDGLIQNVKGLNYMFSVVRSEKVFTPVGEVNELMRRA